MFADLEYVIDIAYNSALAHLFSMLADTNNNCNYMLARAQIRIPHVCLMWFIIRNMYIYIYILRFWNASRNSILSWTSEHSHYLHLHRQRPIINPNQCASNFITFHSINWKKRMCYKDGKRNLCTRNHIHMVIFRN